MLSRVASSIYWMGRYVERAENLARFLDVTLTLTLDQPDSGLEQWEPLVRATGDEQYFEQHYGSYASANVQQFLTFDTAYHSSIHTAVSLARENARTVREAISTEAWEQLNSFYHFVRDSSSRFTAPPAATFYDEVVQHCHLFNGILDATMMRGAGWHFANIGRLLERADKTSRILDVKYFTLLRNVTDVDTTFDDLLWSAVLRSVCGFEMFRKKHHAVTVQRIIDFLILEDKFPRAIRYCVQQTRESLTQVAGPVPLQQNAAINQAQLLIDELRVQEPQKIISDGLHEMIDAIQMALNEIGGQVQEIYFAEREFARLEQVQQ